MVDENQEVIVRQLPEGEPWTALRINGEGQVLRLRLTDPSGLASFHLGDAVEVQGGETLYLGELQGLKEGVLLIEVEHFLKCKDLLEINRVWGSASGVTFR